jgi:hypothetical protein
MGVFVMTPVQQITRYALIGVRRELAACSALAGWRCGFRSSFLSRLRAAAQGSTAPLVGRMHKLE